MRDVLSHFYDKLEGSSWINNTNWKTETPLKEWFGLIVDSEDIVVAINLSGNNLNGEIHEKIAEIKTLTRIDLSQNKIKGEIPESFKNFERLEVLNLSYNEMEGTLHGSVMEKIIDMRFKKKSVN